ncbi:MULTISPECIES: hypothetical protein [Acidithiobacillus]|uniref:Uncharacterized protein n=2 Tax=Acidithiobacillus TaxID=119977 RepID=A0A179B662_ACIFR|nr:MULTISPECIES: hypothetical protein [Acidithiobacillus]MEB8487220.1 hypothetical protein [Acidithiobacillus ferriphilus]MEB8490528.1 hypothetical protein [Acidithiobacillus ferriphilus]MEB8494268.1 hypothetical protein [Acidithiobacillus ferriphilus]MEB8515305.1 hypothetical protein [Acidithiobacillus ferriphilus]MEB8522309.1 hypothetical protein [Acidithiobacillus ferriphilus]
MSTSNLIHEVHDFFHDVYPGLIPGLFALGLAYTYAEQRIGFIGDRPLPKLPEEVWVLNATVAVNVIGCSGASPNSLKGMSAKQISDLYGLSHDETEGLSILLQKTREYSGRLSRIYYFLDCVLGRQEHRARIRREQRTPISKVPVLLLASTPIFLGLFVIDWCIGYLVSRLGLPVPQTWLLAIVLLILPFFLIRPAVRFLIRTPFGLTMKYWYHQVR